jgi:hypothetical protein
MYLAYYREAAKVLYDIELTTISVPAVKSKVIDLRQRQVASLSLALYLIRRRK